MKSASLLKEEKRSTILFLWLFYIVFIVYDIYYYKLFPAFPGLDYGSANPFWYHLNIIKYLIMIAIVPASIYFMKREKTELVKYIVVLSYISINVITDILYFKDGTIAYSSGSLVEVLMILFSPIFVNRLFFITVTGGLVLKYMLVGLFLQDPVVLFPIILILLLSIIGIIILNRFLNYVKALRNSYDEELEGIVKGVIATLELKDPYTRGHSERVAAYAMSMAKESGEFKESELRYFYYACLLHDIGKINIPDSILTKPSKLSDNEYEIIKTHPVVGAEAIKDVEGIADYIDVIYHHHERWDGKGYPEGLVGEETPLLARITAVADAFDAMTSSRSYRPALPFEEAYKRILDGKGSQFDPQLVEVFKRIYPTWVEISKKHENNFNIEGGKLDENS